MIRKLRTAVVGVGYLGRFHAQKYKLIPGSELVGVYDENPERAKQVAQELGSVAFSSLHEVANAAEAVSVASTTTSHFEVGQHLLKAGRHVLMEKPIAARSSQGRELCRIAAENKCIFQVGHIERFNPTWRAITQFEETPKLLQFTRTGSFRTRGSDVDVVTDLMIHDVDLMRSYVRSPIRSVTAHGAKVVTRGWDWARANFEFENQVRAEIFVSRVAPETERKVRALFSDRMVTADLAALSVHQARHEGMVSGPDAWQTKNTIYNKVDALYDEVSSFVRSCLKNTRPLVTGEEGLEALVLVERVLENLNQHH